MATQRQNDVFSIKLASGDHAVAVANVDSTGAAVDVQAIKPTSGALTDRSGTITTGGSPQDAALQNTSRKYLFIENPTYKSDGTTLNPVERLCFRTDAAAGLGAGSICLDIGQSFEYPAHFCPIGAVSVIASTIGHAFTVKEG